ncbi:hypothetical protein OnM2_022085 [Erysiphe neolycopersici]|uniref:Uncharacterized protein n=1 Tax=Erysiphe neolycopersici TaxID=212602 RepID=A0A420I2K5_9PEZI|nr:hypothetical protein OnM2_022085 [Erysiphe neolycopersici]
MDKTNTFATLYQISIVIIHDKLTCKGKPATNNKPPVQSSSACLSNKYNNLTNLIIFDYSEKGCNCIDYFSDDYLTVNRNRGYQYRVDNNPSVTCMVSHAIVINL